MKQIGNIISKPILMKLKLAILFLVSLTLWNCEHLTPEYYNPCGSPEVRFLENGLEVCVKDGLKGEEEEGLAYMYYQTTHISMGFTNNDMSQLGAYGLSFKIPDEGLSLNTRIPCNTGGIQGISMDVEGYMILHESYVNDGGIYYFDGVFEVVLTDPVTKVVTTLSEGEFSFIQTAQP